MRMPPTTGATTHTGHFEAILQVEGARIQQVDNQFRADGGEHAREHTDQHELGEMRRTQLPARRAQRSQQCALMKPFIETRRERRIHNGEAGREHEQQHQFDGRGDLREDGAEPGQYLLHIEYRHRREGAHQFRQQILPIQWRIRNWQDRWPDNLLSSPGGRSCRNSDETSPIALNGCWQLAH